MLRKIVLLFAAVMFCGFNSCTLPSSVEIRVQPDVSLPIGSDSGNLSEVLLSYIRGALSGANSGGSDAKVLNYNGYKVKDGAGKDADAQTFIVQYNILSQPLDFTNEFGDFTGMFDELDNIELDLSKFENIELGDMSSFGDDVSEEPVDVDISKMINSTVATLTSCLDERVSIEGGVNAPLVVGVGDDPSIELRSFVFEMEGFDEIKFKTGKLGMKFEISSNPPAYDLDGVNFYFESIQIQDGTNAIDGKCDDSKIISFTKGSPASVVVFDLGGETLKNDFTIVLSGFNDSSTQTKLLSLSIDEPDLENVVVRSVKGYEIKDDDPIESNIDPYTILIGFDNNFLHAQIETGTIEFMIVFPSDFEDENATWIKLDNNLTSIIYMLQDETNLEGENWKGISGATGNAGNPAEYWLYSKGNNNLSDKHINSGNITIGNNSKIVITGGKIDFNLSDDVVDKVPVKVKPSLQIDKFSLLHMKADDLLNVPQIDPVSLGEAAKYLKSIDFEKAGVKLKFGEIDINGLQIMIHEPTLGINPSKTPKDIESGGEAEFVRNNFTLDIQDSGGNPLIDELKFEIELTHKGNNQNYFEISDLNVSQGSIKFEIEYESFFKDHWTSAVVNMSQMDQEDSFSIDSLSQIGNYLNGFSFNDIKSYLYIDGPDSFFEMDPDISFKVFYGAVPGPDLFFDEFHLRKMTVPNLTGENFSGNLPEGTPVNFKQILNDQPEELKIEYAVKLGELTITPKTLEDLTNPDGSSVDVAVIIILPMSIKANPGGATFAIPAGIFGDGDIFGRTGAEGEFSITDIIKKLTLRIGLSSSVFSGGEIYMREAGETPGNELLRFDLSGKTMKIPITGKMLDEINKKIPYEINDMGIRFNGGSTLIIPSDLGVLNIAFDAEIVYEIEL